MKMRNDLKAPRDGRVKSVAVKAGQTVAKGMCWWSSRPGCRRRWPAAAGVWRGGRRGGGRFTSSTTR